ncbi:MAG TPA: WhiB family transcriptional regulator [Acidimicrobiales bacterium]|nr:WhiB family transcriptional regulator [Acidimicrobiales bacterium]
MPDTLDAHSRRVDELEREVTAYLSEYGPPGDEWRQRGACLGVDPSVFFPERGEATLQAQIICAECPVRVECLTWSIVTRERQGVWGGVAERTRRLLRRRLDPERGGYAASA